MTTAGADDHQTLELEQSVHRDPASGSAWGRLGRAYQDAGAHELARTAFEQARAAWLAAARAEGKPVPPPRYRPAIDKTA